MAKTIEKERSQQPITRTSAGHDAERLVLPHYVIARHGTGGPELLHVSLKSGEGALPVFSSREAADAFLLSNTLASNWYARESYAGELVSLLLGLYAGTGWVLVDPLSGDLAAEEELADTMHWKSFVDRLLG